MRTLLICAVLLLAAPASAGAAFGPTLGVVDVASGQRSVIARGAARTSGWSSVRWTPDGSAIVAVSGGAGAGVLRPFPVAGGPARPVGRLGGAGGPARLVRDLGDALQGVLSWDGSMVVARYDGGHGIPGGRGGVVVRELATGRVRLRLPQDAEGDDLYENGLDVAWSRDGRRIAYVAQERRGRTLRIADVRSGRVLSRIDADGVYRFNPDAFSPAGDRLAYPSGNNLRLTLLDVATGAVQRTRETRVLTVAWAPAGERLAISTQDGVFSSDEQRHFALLDGTWDSVFSLHWSPDGTTLGFLTSDFTEVNIELGVMQVLPTSGPPQIIVPHRSPDLGAFEWSPDGRRIAYSG